MSREIVFYGEKGILNSIVLDIQGDIAKQKQFIRSIILADKSKLSWVDSVHTVKCFMAPSLDQFGDPDMIMEAVTTDGEKYVLFIVTTTATYQNSALIMNQLEEKDNQYLPKTYINNSKKLNVQLSLLYRFVQAYKNNPLDVYDINSIIVEEHEVSLTYNDSMERKLENWIMMDYWNENFQDAKDYYYIAITNDSKEVIDEKNANSRLFPYNNFSTMPPIGSERWEEDKGKFGITTYDTLAHKNVISKNNGYYKDTSDLMLLTPPTIADYKKIKSPKALVNINTDRWTENQKELCGIINEIKELDEDFKSFITNFMDSIEYS